MKGKTNVNRIKIDVLGNDGPLSNRNQMKARGERMPGLRDAPSSRKGIKHLI